MPALNMFDEPFSQGNSLLHRIDPRFRVALAMICVICLASIQTLSAACLGAAFSFLLVLLAHLAPGALLKRLVFINIFIVFLWITVPLSMKGEFIAAYGPFHISKEGIFLSLLVTLKCNGMAFIFFSCIATMNSPIFAHALERLHFPSKLVFLLLFTYRYIHVISDEWKRLYAAAQLRGFKPKTNLRTYGVFSAMLGMVFIRSFERSTRVYEAMQLRGFCGKFCSVTSFQAQQHDMIFACFVALGLSAVMTLNFFPGIVYG